MNHPRPQPVATGPAPESVPGARRFTHEAMATVYAVMLLHPSKRYSRQAAHEAFRHLDQLEEDLSRFLPNSDIARINALPSGEPLILGLPAYDCLEQCRQIAQDTGGAFDITIGPLMKCWLREDRTLRDPTEGEWAEAREKVGMDRYVLDAQAHTVQLPHGPVQLDLGGFGKGYAVDRMAELLREWDVDSALVHGGGSTVLAFDPPPGMEGWPVTISMPGDRRQIIARLQLARQALSGSGLKKAPHIIDPRTARPIDERRSAWCLAPTAGLADALSTAFMVMSPDEVEDYCRTHPETSALWIEFTADGEQSPRIYRFGPWAGAEFLI